VIQEQHVRNDMHINYFFEKMDMIAERTALMINEEVSGK
jgi:hypothetical protein